MVPVLQSDLQSDWTPQDFLSRQTQELVSDLQVQKIMQLAVLKPNPLALLMA